MNGKDFVLWANNNEIQRIAPKRWAVNERKAYKVSIMNGNRSPTPIHLSGLKKLCWRPPSHFNFQSSADRPRERSPIPIYLSAGAGCHQRIKTRLDPRQAQIARFLPDLPATIILRMNKLMPLINQCQYCRAISKKYKIVENYGNKRVINNIF